MLTQEEQITGEPCGEAPTSDTSVSATRRLSRTRGPPTGWDSATGPRAVPNAFSWNPPTTKDGGLKPGRSGMPGHSTDLHQGLVATVTRPPLAPAHRGKGRAGCLSRRDDSLALLSPSSCPFWLSGEEQREEDLPWVPCQGPRPGLAAQRTPASPEPPGLRAAPGRLASLVRPLNVP